MSVRSLIEAYNALDKLDLRVLRLIEIAHVRHRYVPYRLIARWAKADEGRVGASLSKLNKLKLIQRVKGPYEGFRLTFGAYDVLALHSLRKAGKVVSISPTPIGVGKESIVYTGESPSGVKIALKFHRTGTSSFAKVKRLRSFLGRRRHLTKLYEARLSAHAEFAALSTIFDAGGHVPEPVAVNRHVVVMRYIDGVEAYRAELADAKPIAEDVLKTIEIALDNGIIHGDLTPYNIIVGDRAYVIDWPQWVPATHPNAEEILSRDLSYLDRYFSRYGIHIDSDSILDILRNKKYKIINIDNILSNVLKSFKI